MITKETFKSIFRGANEKLIGMEERSQKELDNLKSLNREIESLKNMLDEVAKSCNSSSNYNSNNGSINRSFGSTNDEKESIPTKKVSDKRKEQDKKSFELISSTNDKKRTTFDRSVDSESKNKGIKTVKSITNLSKTSDDNLIKSTRTSPKKIKIDPKPTQNNYCITVSSTENSDNTKSFQRTKTLGLLSPTKLSPTKKLTSNVAFKVKLNPTQEEEKPEKSKPPMKRLMTMKNLNVVSKNLGKEPVKSISTGEKVVLKRSNSKIDVKKQDTKKNKIILSSFSNKDKNSSSSFYYSTLDKDKDKDASNLEIHSEVNEFDAKEHDEDDNELFNFKIDEIEHKIMQMEQYNDFEIIEDIPIKIEIIEEPKKTFMEYIDSLYHKGWLDKMTQFLSKKDHIVSFPFCKFIGSLSLKILIEEANRELREAKLNLDKFRSKYPQDFFPTSESFQPFVMSRGASRAIDLLNETIYNKIFLPGNNPSDDVKLIYRIFFFMINRSDIAEIKNQSDFWKACSNFIITEGNGKTGTLIGNLGKSFEFSDINIYKINKLVNNQVNKIAPAHFSKMCATTGLFIFLIKDAMEYAGVVFQEKKTPAGRMITNFSFEVAMAEEKINRLTSLLEGPYRI